MTGATLKLRNDLIFSLQGDAEKKSYVVKNPSAGRFFRLGELECFIARQLDGATPLEEVQKRVEEHFGSTISIFTLEQLVEWLRGRGLLADGQTKALPYHHTSRRVGGNLLYLRLKAYDPDQFLDWLNIKLGFLFTPAFVFLSSALILFAFGLTVANWPDMSLQLRTLLRFESLLLAWFVLLGVIVLHEFAHGLTCKHFGGQVHEMGFMLLYFQPAFYCNVSDAWLFPSKKHRLWVTFAGAYFEMFLWALAVLVWRVTEVQSSVNHFSLIIVATSVIKSIFNLNPLIKLDGYYLLSDWLNIPNLRSRATQYLRSFVGSRLGLPENEPSNATVRERRICLVYGTIATAFSLWLLTVIALSVGNHLVTKYQGWGFIAFVALLAIAFRNSIKKAVHIISTAFQTASLTNMKWKKFGKLIVLCILALSILCIVNIDLRISGPFVILPVQNDDIRTEVSGIVQDVFVDEGDTVKAGQPIARLSDRDFQSELRQTRAAIDEKQAKLRLLKLGPRAEEIEMAKTTVTKAEEQIKYARNRLEMDQKLFGSQLLSLREVELSEEQLIIRKKELEEDSERLRMLQAGNRPEEIEAVAAEVSKLEVQQRHLEEQLRLLNIITPVAGIIATHKPREIVGEHLSKGDLVVKVYDLDVVTAEISVSEKDIAAVAVGQPVKLKCRAWPQKTFHGTVTAIRPVATTPNDMQTERTVLVTTQIRNEGYELKPEMSGNAKISCGSQRLIESLTRRLARYLRVEFWSWW